MKAQAALARGDLIRLLTLLVVTAALAANSSLSFGTVARGSGMSGPGAPVLAEMNGVTCMYHHFTNLAGLSINGSSCRPLFDAVYDTGTVNLNLTFGVSWLAEVSSAGSVVALASFLNATPENTTASSDSSGTTFNMSFSAPVTNGTGQWLPSDTAYGTGSQPFRQGSQSLGKAFLALEFHLGNGGSSSSSAKFDVAVLGWPWSHPSDELGLEVDATAMPGDGFAYNATGASLTESSLSGNATDGSLVFGSSATAWGPGAGQLSVQTSAEAFSAGARDNVAAVLLTFAGAQGGYPGLTYDPWVEFPSARGPAPSPTLVAALVVAAGVIGTVSLVVATRRARKVPSEAGLSSVGVSAPQPLVTR